MIYGYLHQGSGAGNQLFRMVATRVKAFDLGVDWRMIYNPDGSGKPEGFKCKDFMEFDENKILKYVGGGLSIFNEKKIVENGVDTRSFDPEFNFIQDNTIIDGELQDERYWMHREQEVNEWLKVEPLDMPDDLCVIGFRGGEFAVFPDLYLTKEYWEEAIKRMRKINPNMRFEVHTDDVHAAHQTLDTLVPKITRFIHDIGINWRSARYAKHAIIANSSFFILPRWLNKGITISPRYWARRNTKTWCLPQNYYGRFSYI